MSHVNDVTPITVGPVVVKARDPMLSEQRCVAVLNTGGTIGMKANASGSLEPSPGYLAERICAMDEFKRGDTPAVDLYELLPLLDSSDMGPADWLRIAQMIESIFYSYDGFVIVMGTDTMAYCGSALSFLLENLNKPVILTGAMLPLVDLFNDAHRNLIVSVVLASILDVPEVCIFINDKLMRGNRTVKVSSSGLDAFDSPNFPPLALLETGIRFRPHLCLPQPRGRFRVNKALSTAVAVWRMVPGFDDHYIRVSIRETATLRAIVLELYGTGNLSARKSSLIDALTEAIEKGIIIVATSQCLRGTVNLSAYALGKQLESIGVVQAGDMTTETVCAKLAYLMAIPGVTRDQVIFNMGRNLRGEITESKPVMALGSRGVMPSSSSSSSSSNGHGAGSSGHSIAGVSPASVQSGVGAASRPLAGARTAHGNSGSFAVPSSPNPYPDRQMDPDSPDFYSSASIVTFKPIPTVAAPPSSYGSVDTASIVSALTSSASSTSYGGGAGSPVPSLSLGGSTTSSSHHLHHHHHGGMSGHNPAAGAVPIKITGDPSSGAGQGEVVIQMRAMENNQSAVALGFGDRPDFSSRDFLPPSTSQSVAHSARITMAPGVGPIGHNAAPTPSPAPSAAHALSHARGLMSPVSPHHAVANGSPSPSLSQAGATPASVGAETATPSENSSSAPLQLNVQGTVLPRAGEGNRAGRASINHLQALLTSAATITSSNGLGTPPRPGASPRSGAPPPPPPSAVHHYHAPAIPSPLAQHQLQQQ